jgi:hypothetical protein
VKRSPPRRFVTRPASAAGAEGLARLFVV